LHRYYKHFQIDKSKEIEIHDTKYQDSIFEEKILVSLKFQTVYHLSQEQLRHNKKYILEEAKYEASKKLSETIINNMKVDIEDDRYSPNSNVVFSINWLQDGEKQQYKEELEYKDKLIHLESIKYNKFLEESLHDFLNRRYEPIYDLLKMWSFTLIPWVIHSTLSLL
jgi:hypothetical protein